MKAKLVYLESLRGLAALTVALVHVPNAPLIARSRLIANGDMMVDFFFVLSGFVIAYTYLDRVADLRSLAVFQARRFWRLYPLHLASLLAFLGLEAAQYGYELYTGSTGAAPAFARNTPAAFLNNLLLLHPFFEQDLTFNYPSWSISSEFYTYLAFGLLLLAPRAARLPAFLTVALASAVTLQVFGGVVQTRELALIRCTYSFFIGVLTWLVVKVRSPGQLSGTPGAVFVALGVGLMCIPEYFPQMLLPLVFSGVVGTLVLGREDSLIKKLLSQRRVVYLGTISYSIYMVHAWIWEAMNIFVVKGLGYTLAADGATVDLSPQGQMLWVATGMALTIVCAHVSYHTVEQPWRQH